MACIYSQGRNDPNMVMIVNQLAPEACTAVINRYAVGWHKSKRGRSARPLGSLEMGFYFSDGKLACTMWVDPCPAPVNEPKFTPATGEIPGLKS